MTIRSSGTLLANISQDLADNNAGEISAADVRNNMYDTVESINAIVASGNTDTIFPFYNNVRAKKIGSVGGTFIAESGILFPNAPVNSASRQVEPFLGVANIQHNQLAGLNDADPHSQYLPISGSRPMTGNLRMGANWIGSDGVSGKGFKFVESSSGTQILTSGFFTFGDNSVIKSGRGSAKAWITFDGNNGSNVPEVKAAYNITALDDLGQGKFRVRFASGIMGGTNYVAIGTSNARTSASSQEDFGMNTVGTVLRTANDVTFVILNHASGYIDGEINDLVVFAPGPGVSASGSF